MSVKEFKTYEEQLGLLQRRGMIVNNREWALSILESENYYRLSGYWFYLLDKEDPENEVFKPGTTFEKVVDTYRFDEELRNVLFRATSIVETNLKAFVAYYHAWKYGPIGYLDYRTFEKFNYFSVMISALSKDIDRLKDSAFVQHHKDANGGVFPVWAAVELFTFDQISKFFRNMLPSDRGEIARRYYSISSREHVESWLMCSVILRNAVAHGSRLYNKYFSIPIRIRERGVERTLFGYILGIMKLLSDSERYNLIKAIKGCIENHPDVELNRIGFPPDWESFFTKRER